MKLYVCEQTNDIEEKREKKNVCLYATLEKRTKENERKGEKERKSERKIEKKCERVSKKKKETYAKNKKKKLFVGLT